jgi:hypothetical protein
VDDSDSPFASPVLLLKKKCGAVRMCVGYRGLNKQTVKLHYPLSRIDDHLDRLGGKKYYTYIDMKSGSYQIPIKRTQSRKQLL